MIAPLRDNKFADLPLFVGRDAETAAAEFYARFRSGRRFKSAGEGLSCALPAAAGICMLDNGVVIKLPEHDIDRAMQVLSTMERGSSCSSATDCLRSREPHPSRPEATPHRARGRRDRG